MVGLLPVTSTAWPRLWNSCAVAKPMPEVPPVTRATGCGLPIDSIHLCSYDYTNDVSDIADLSSSCVVSTTERGVDDGQKGAAREF